MSYCVTLLGFLYGIKEKILSRQITYLAEADETQILIVNADENKGVKWFSFEDALKASTEPWMVEHVYKKLIGKTRYYKQN